MYEYLNIIIIHLIVIDYLLNYFHDVNLIKQNAITYFSKNLVTLVLHIGNKLRRKTLEATL